MSVSLTKMEYFFLFPGSELLINSRTLKPVSLNTVLFVYLFL